MTMRFVEDRPRRRPNLTPMIDVVFLLLVFFMLATRFGAESVIPLGFGGAGGVGWQGPPRLVEAGPDGMLRLNGIVIAPEMLAPALAPLVSAAADAIVLRGAEGATLADLVMATEALANAGYPNILLAE